MVSLAQLFGRQVETPEQRLGRTIYFDWLDYQGGQVAGQPICCRVIGVPGQAELADRRATILRAADVVVFVADTTAAGFPESRRHFADLRRRLEGRAVPVVLQLNKRDAADALPVDQVRTELDPELLALETTATEGSGLRETFILAIGEAIRGRWRAEALGEPLERLLDVEDPATLFDLLTRDVGLSR